MIRVPLLESWQDGPAWVELELDELVLDDGFRGTGVIFRCSSPLGSIGEHELDIGTGRVMFPAGGGRFEFLLAGSLDHARQLRDALTLILEEARS